MDSATWSSVTICESCSKWVGLGSSWLASPLMALFGQISKAVLRAAFSSFAQHRVICAYFGFPGPASLSNCRTSSCCGPIPHSPSPIRPATWTALGPEAETMISGACSGRS
jgi:hypothetical protein